MASEAAAVRVALTTVGSVDEARRMARLLVERGVAACVNLIPNLTSVYRWQGAIEEAEEVLLLMKTSAARLPALEAAVRELHSYETPEFVALEIASVSEPYLKWLLGSVGQ